MSMIQFTEAVDDILTDLQTTQEAVVTAKPIAARPAQLRDQLDANKAIIESMNRKLAELELVKADADKMIAEAGGVEDESVKGNMIASSFLTLLLLVIFVFN